MTSEKRRPALFTKATTIPLRIISVGTPVSQRSSESAIRNRSPRAGESRSIRLRMNRLGDPRCLRRPQRFHCGSFRLELRCPNVLPIRNPQSAIGRPGAGESRSIRLRMNRLGDPRCLRRPQRFQTADHFGWNSSVPTFFQSAIRNPTIRNRQIPFLSNRTERVSRSSPVGVVKG